MQAYWSIPRSRTLCRNVRTKQTKQTKSGVWTSSPAKRDDFLPTRCALANVPSSGVHILWPAMASGWCPAVRCFPKLSKLLNQEDALSIPCLRGDFCSPQARPRGRRNAADGRYPSLRCHFTVCCTQVIMLARADAFPVVGGRCTGRARRCKAKQGRRGKTAMTCGFYFHSSTVFGPRRD